MYFECRRAPGKYCVAWAVYRDNLGNIDLSSFSGGERGRAILGRGKGHSWEDRPLHTGLGVRTRSPRGDLQGFSIAAWQRSWCSKSAALSSRRNGEFSQGSRVVLSQAGLSLCFQQDFWSVWLWSALITGREQQETSPRESWPVGRAGLAEVNKNILIACENTKRESGRESWQFAGHWDCLNVTRRSEEHGGMLVSYAISMFIFWVIFCWIADSSALQEYASWALKLQFFCLCTEKQPEGLTK